MKSISYGLAALSLSLSLTACHSSKKMSRGKSPYHRLKSDLSMAQVSRMGDTIRVIYPELAMFDFGKDEIKTDARSSLTRFGGILQEYPSVGVVINGYTDNLGTDEVNYDLSNRRATAARSLLQGTGVDASRMSTAGKGPQNPLASNGSDEGRQANRRVEFLLYSNR